MRHSRSRIARLFDGGALCAGGALLTVSAMGAPVVNPVAPQPVAPQPVATSEPAREPAASSGGSRTAEDAPAPPAAPLPAEESATPTNDVTANERSQETLSTVARRLDEILGDAASDLGFPAGTLEAARVGQETTLVEEQLYASKLTGLRVVPLVNEVSGKLVVKLLARRGSHPMLLSTRFYVDLERLEVQVIRALRAITESPSPTPESGVAPPQALAPQARPFSEGQALFAANGAIIGGYLGFALEHIGGGSDPRLLYPVIALGAGVGVGTSFVVAGEWDVSVADAWYISAASTWPTLGATLLASQAQLASPDDRFAFGLLGTAAGITLGAVALNFGEVSEGGALLTHSGGFFGGILGGVAQRVIDPKPSAEPSLGVGIGVSAGVLAAGFLAPWLPKLSAPRMLFVDLGGSLGALAGAALASPFVVGTVFDETENRLWYGSIGLGVVVGATLAVLLTHDSDNSRPAAAPWMASWSPDVRSVSFGDADAPHGMTLGVRHIW
jgi:hypothetical protein